MKLSFRHISRAVCDSVASRPGMHRLIFIAFALGLLHATADTKTPLSETLEQAQKQFKAQNWAEARTSYDRARDLAGNWHAPEARLAVEGAVACSMRLQLWDDALSRAQTFVDNNKGRFEEAVGERFLGGLYLCVPHEGTKQGGAYHRGQYGQGVQVSSFKKDRNEAVRRYEHARDILAGLVKAPATPDNSPERQKLLNAEQIGLDFDLVAALATHDYGYSPWGWCLWWWDSGEPEEDSTAVEEADYEQPRWFNRYASQQEKPTGLPLAPDGKPRFFATPDAYAAQLGAGPKIRFILGEIQRLDLSENRNDAAKALFRQAMICRGLYGPDIIAQWNGLGTQYDRFGHPLPKPPEPDAPARKIWELAEDETIAIAGGRLQVVTLPAGESPMALLAQIEKDCPKSNLVPEAIYSRALYLQSRQQFPEAVAEYERLQKLFPDAPRSQNAKKQIGLIRKPGVLLDPTGVHLPGEQPVLSFSYRNTGEISFTARRFDLNGFINDSLDHPREDTFWRINNLPSQIFQDNRWKPYLGAKVSSWTDQVPRDEANRAAAGKTSMPLSDPGAYIVEARAGDSSEITRVLVFITDLAIVHKNLPDKGLIYVADARTGQPIANHAIRVVETWMEWNQQQPNKPRFHVINTNLVTDKDGALEYQRKERQHGSSVDAIVIGEKGRAAYSFFQNWSESSYDDSMFEQGPRVYVITDRAVYRPGTTVKFRVWMRYRQNAQYNPPQAGQSIGVQIYDAKGNQAFTTTSKTDENGCFSGEYAVPVGAPLGTYQVRIDNTSPDGRYNAGGIFRVEEYKKPEFSVKVTPAKTLARLGEKVSAKIAAEYYFGAPVAQGHVSYKIFREDYHHVYWGPGEYDWLYGAGYGRDYYPYPWFPWWGRWGCFILGDLWPWYGWPYGGFGNYGDDQAAMDRRSAESGTRHALRELVSQGEGELKADGTYDVEFDSAPALHDLGDRDHRYTIEAEVRDASRRTITGQGDIKVTRQQFYAFAETTNGWHQPRDDAFIDVRTLTADNTPVATQGRVTVYRIHYDDAGTPTPKEEEMKSWDAQTDADGRLSFKYPIPSEGQYRITYRTQDAWKQEVQANTVFWVCGPKFDGRLYRFNDLEIIADKRSYQPGDTAHLLINTAENNDRILFSDDASQDLIRSYRFIDLPQRSTVIDVPITDARMPNFFVEATLVRKGRVHQESRELYVPPAKNLLHLTVETDKPIYKPGEQGKVQVHLTNADGQPVSGHVTLTAFDEAVTYIQDEFGPAPKVFYYGQRRVHRPFVDASLDRTYQPMGQLDAPQSELYVCGIPEGWQGFWPISSHGLTLSGTGAIGGTRGKDLEGYFQNRDEAISEKAMVGGLLSANSGAVTMTAAINAPMADAASAPASPMGGMDDLKKEATKSKQDQDGSGLFGQLFSTPPLVEATIRTNFADTALWLPDLKTDDSGRAEMTITFPDSLTTWRVHGYGLTLATQVGDGITHATTTKNLIVRLEAPRFFIERDEVVLSANVHNYLGSSKKVSAELILPAAIFQPLESGSQPDKDGNLHLTASATVDAKSEHRFDWPVKVIKAGLASVTTKALTNEESDGMQMTFPVLVHGINKMIAQGGSYRVGDNGARDLKLNLPAEIDPEQTKLEVTLSPSLSGVMIDALPYLAGYPYGCVEQTMSRFYPSVLVKDTLKKMGTDLESVAKQRKQMYPPDVKNRFGRSHDPVFDSDELDRMVRAGLQRIHLFQHDDGGWGWWSDDESSPFETAYVIQGLQAARTAGVDVGDGSYQRGISFLQNSIQRELAKPKDKQYLGGYETQSYVAYILALTGQGTNDAQVKWLDELYEKRGDQNNYGKALLALTFHLRKQEDRASLLLQNILQFAERDDSNETAWIRTPQAGWWFWWNNDIETNAWVLKALATIEPRNDLAPRIVKWLLNNRKNGTYWRSTRDTAQVIAAMADYMRASGEGRPDYDLVVKLDGQEVKKVHVSQDNFFTFDNRFALYGLQVTPGPHVVTLEKNGAGALYYSAYLSYFTKEEDIKGAGNEIGITREYYLLKPKTETVKAQTQGGSGWGWWSNGATNPNPAGQESPDAPGTHVEQRAGWDRIALHNGDSVDSGQQIEVVLKIHAKNTYDYLAFEDMKPAGCEPVEMRSGGKFAGGLCPNVELRDEKVVFFIGLLEQGDHILRYKLRAETPGTFHALPSSGYAMYAPEVRAISDEMRLKIDDK